MPTLKFKPFSQYDIAMLFANTKFPDKRIEGYKLTNWFNKRKNTLMHGVMVKVKGKGIWNNLCNGDRAVVFDNIDVAKDVLKAFNNLQKK